MTRSAASLRSSGAEAPTWEDTLPHFSTSEEGDRITATPLHAPAMPGFFGMVTFVLWVPVVAAASIWFHHAGQAKLVMWQPILIVLSAFVPMMLTGITADEARNAFGQRTTANRVAAIPACAGVGVGLLAAGLWIGGFVGGLLASASVVFSLAAVVAIIGAWAGIRYTRRRQAWMASVRHYGRRSPGVLSEVTFLEKWSGGEPQFTVAVDVDGRRSIAAHMTTSPDRVPQPGTSVVVFSGPHDTRCDVLIELDAAKPVEFNPRTDRYVQPSGN